MGEVNRYDVDICKFGMGDDVLISDPGGKYDLVYEKNGKKFLMSTTDYKAEVSRLAAELAKERESREIADAVIEKFSGWQSEACPLEFHDYCPEKEEIEKEHKEDIEIGNCKDGEDWVYRDYCPNEGQEGLCWVAHYTEQAEQSRKGEK